MHDRGGRGGGRGASERRRACGRRAPGFLLRPNSTLTGDCRFCPPFLCAGWSSWRTASTSGTRCSTRARRAACAQSTTSTSQSGPPTCKARAPTARVWIPPPVSRRHPWLGLGLVLLWDGCRSPTQPRVRPGVCCQVACSHLALTWRADDCSARYGAKRAQDACAHPTPPHHHASCCCVPERGPVACASPPIAVNHWDDDLRGGSPAALSGPDLSLHLQRHRQTTNARSVAICAGSAHPPSACVQGDARPHVHHVGALSPHGRTVLLMAFVGAVAVAAAARYGADVAAGHDGGPFRSELPPRHRASTRAS